MNVINRSDAGGKYISSKKEVESFDAKLLHPIAYNKDVAELASQQKRKYREVFLELINNIEE